MKTMKRMTVMLLIVAMLCTALIPCASAAALTDIEGHWGQTYIEYWVERGVVNGYPDGTFRPDRYITRAEVCKVLALAYQMPTDVEPTDFSDVEEDSWYYDYVQTCAAFGSVNGYPDGTFLPLGNITRSEAVKMVCLSAGLSVRDTGCEGFGDYSDIPEWAVGYWNALYNQGVIDGYPIDGCLHPNDYITRAELVKILCFVTTEIKIYELSVKIEDNIGNAVSDKSEYLTGDSYVIATLVPLLIANYDNFDAAFPSYKMRELLDQGLEIAQRGYANDWDEATLAEWEAYLVASFSEAEGERSLIDLMTNVHTTVATVARDSDYVFTFYDTKEGRTDIQYTVTIRVEVMD